MSTMLDSGPEARARFGAMTTGMRLYLAQQSDFYVFTKAPRTLGIWSNSPRPSRTVGEACELAVKKGYGIFMALW